MNNDELILRLKRITYQNLQQRFDYVEQNLLGEDFSTFAKSYRAAWMEYLLWTDFQIKQPVKKELMDFQEVLTTELYQHLIEKTDSISITNPEAYDILYNPEHMDTETYNNLYYLAEMFYNDN